MSLVRNRTDMNLQRVLLSGVAAASVMAFAVPTAAAQDSMRDDVETAGVEEEDAVSRPYGDRVAHSDRSNLVFGSVSPSMMKLSSFLVS